MTKRNPKRPDGKPAKDRSWETEMEAAAKLSAAREERSPEAGPQAFHGEPERLVLPESVTDSTLHDSEHMQALDAPDAEFRAADFPEKMQLVKEACLAQSLDAEWLVEWFFDLNDSAKTEAERRAFGECVDVLRDSFPEVYQESAGRLLNLRLKDALRDNRDEDAKRQFVDLSRFAPNEIDYFFQRADQLAYRGFLQAVLEGFRIGWPLVRESSDVLRQGIEEYAETGAAFEVFASLESQSQKDQGYPELAQRIREFWGRESDKWEKTPEGILNPDEAAWDAEDFKITRKAFRKDKGERLRFENRLDNLLNAFLGWLHREKEMSYSRANLAREGMFAYLTKRLDGGLPDVAFLEQAPYKDNPVAKILCPDRITLDEFLAMHFSLLGPRVHRAMALFEAVPYWLEFLVKKALLSEESRRLIFGILSGLVPTVRTECDGPWATGGDWPALEQAWTQSA